MTVILMELNYIHSTAYLRDGSSWTRIFDKYMVMLYFFLKGRDFLIVSYKAYYSEKCFRNKQKFGDSGLLQTVLLHY